VTEERTATIGNLPPASRAMFLRDVAAVLTPQDHFLLGVDLVKTSGGSRRRTTTLPG
jgi:uncharacterized SAM-dependent methyltransferase